MAAEVFQPSTWPPLVCAFTGQGSRHPSVGACLDDTNSQVLHLSPIPIPTLQSPCLIQPPKRSRRTSHPEPLSLRVLLTSLPPHPGTPHQPCSRLSHPASWACSEHFFPPQPPCPPTIRCEVWGRFSGPQFLCQYNEGGTTKIKFLRWGLYLAFRVDEITCTLVCFNILT